MLVPNEDDVINRHDIGAQGLLLDWEQGKAALQRLHASPYQFGYEPAGSRYHDLLRLAQRWCSYATLVMQDFRWTGHALAAAEELRPWHAADVSSLEWPGTQVLKAAKVMVFRFEAASADVLGRLARRLYQWEQPDLPEDLCLFRPTGEPWLVSIAHESDGWVNVTRDELPAVAEAIRPLPLKFRRRSLR